MIQLVINTSIMITFHSNQFEEDNSPKLKMETYEDSVFSLESPLGITIHATTKPRIPYPFRANNTNVLYVNSSSFAKILREQVGLGKLNGLFTSHDFFSEDGEISPLTHQLHFLCRINMEGEIEVREEEIIYNPINKVTFQYYSPEEGGVCIDHDQMMDIVNKTKENTNNKFQVVTDYFDMIDNNLQNELNEIFVGKYPREIWKKFDMITASKSKNETIAK
jgi:hypothetical protein